MRFSIGIHLNFVYEVTRPTQKKVWGKLTENYHSLVHKMFNIFGFKKMGKIERQTPVKTSQ